MCGTSTRVRQRTVAEIARLRATLAAMPDKTQAYDAVYAVVETLRDAAAHLNLLAIAVLNQKPPLTCAPCTVKRYGASIGVCLVWRD